jgi:hypothetical protein
MLTRAANSLPGRADTWVCPYTVPPISDLRPLTFDFRCLTFRLQLPTNFTMWSSIIFRLFCAPYPDRYAKNVEEWAIRSCPGRVSIPDRYAKNARISLILSGSLGVSIPDRYAKNKLTKQVSIAM